MVGMLIFHKTEESPQSKKFSWDAWYAENRARLSSKRAKRYREDPAYRSAALARSRQQRENKKQETVIVDGPTISFSDAAQALNITVWVLREWRRKNYFPEPFRRDGRLWFSHEQVELLKKLQLFFFEHGGRVTESKKPALEGVIGLVYANWA
jgi:hypothetical protein